MKEENKGNYPKGSDTQLSSPYANIVLIWLNYKIYWMTYKDKFLKLSLMKNCGYSTVLHEWLGTGKLFQENQEPQLKLLVN